MAEVKWIKIVPNVFDDDKIKLIEEMPEGDSIIVIWFKLLCLAGKQNRDGFLLLNDKIAYTDEMLATIFRRPLNLVRLALGTFEQFEMIEIVNGAVFVSNWEKYQNTDRLAEIREYNRLAQQKSRAKKKLLADVNDKSMTSQRCQDTEEEEEKDKEKEFHSFNHSCDEERYIEDKVAMSGFDGKDASAYREEVKEGLKLKYMNGTLGQGVVFMSDEQFSSLCDMLSLEEIDKYFSIIVECEKSGKRYKKKSHYQAIIDMARKDRTI